MDFFFLYGTFMQQMHEHSFIAIKKRSQILQISKAFQAFYAAGHWELCSSFLCNTHHNWNKYNQSQLEKEKSALLGFIWQQNNLQS